MISGVILTHNEEHNVVDCIAALRPHVAEIILVDTESIDQTVELARNHVDLVLTHPHVANFDAARNIAIPRARFDWMWFVDADERIPATTGQMVKSLIASRGHEFEAINIPFKNYFCGQWMQHCSWWPGYTGCRILKRGHFEFSPTLHTPAKVQGREIRLPPDPSIAVDHFSYRSLEHYVTKFNSYTTTEAAQFATKGNRWDWRQSMREMVRDLWFYYEHCRGDLDLERGWILSWLSGQYRWLSRAKLIDAVGVGEAGRPPSIPENLDAVVDLMEVELAKLRAANPQLPLGLTWRSPIWGSSGYADDARAFVKALATGPRPLAVYPTDRISSKGFLASDDAALFTALSRAKPSKYAIAITQSIPTHCQPDPRASINVLRTMFETDRIPDHWKSCLSQFDEIWVPTDYNRDAFRRSWVAPEKLRVVPGCIDTDIYTPTGPKLQLPDGLAGRFVFLSVFDWQLRKGWDVLLRAFASEFDAAEAVGLLLKISRVHVGPLDSVVEQAESVLAKIGQSLRLRPDIVIWDQLLDTRQMAALYRSVQAFVLPTRGEGWGRPYTEAMASELPVIGTNCSSNMTFLNSGNSFLVPAVLVDVPEKAGKEIPVFCGHRWYEPDVDELRTVLRLVFSQKRLRRSKARRALREIRERFSLDCGRLAVEQAIAKAESRFEPAQLSQPAADQIRVEWEGEFFAYHSFANINEAVSLELAKDPGIALSLRRAIHCPPYDAIAPLAFQIRPYFGRPLDGGPQVTVRHKFPPNWESPHSGCWIHFQHWELDYIPEDWIEPLRDRVDEIWVASIFVRDAFHRSGVPLEKLQVIPLGVDPNVFNADVVPLLFPFKKSFIFLFVGGTIERKGFDRALIAYLAEFGPDEDVCLVVKDIGAQSFYRDVTWRDKILRVCADAGSPLVYYIDDLLTPGQLASLYTACNCLVAPYRGEGFGLPILEAMACGVPPIVPDGGPSDDFTSRTTAYRLSSTRVPAGHPSKLCGPPSEFAVGIKELRQAMRHAFENRDQTSRMGQEAARSVADAFTWQRTAKVMADRIRVLAKDRESPERPSPGPNRAPAIRERLDTVAIVLAIHNNERTLADRLARIAPFVDEIIVVDACSSDRSAVIAREYGAQVVTVQSGTSREQSMELCRKATRCKWLFCAELKDMLDENDAREIKGVLNRQVAGTKRCSLETARGIRLTFEATSIRQDADDGQADFLKTFGEFYLPHLKQRGDSFRQVFAELIGMQKPRYVIVETGCIRKTHDWDDGQSTLLFDHFVAIHGGEVISVDSSEENCRFAKERCSQKAEIVNMDSVVFLNRFAKERPNSIDLLYLDSLDVDWENPHASALHHFNELCAAMPALCKGAIVAVDDHRSASGRPGKSVYIVDYMARIGAPCLFEGYQVAWRLT